MQAQSKGTGQPPPTRRSRSRRRMSPDQVAITVATFETARRDMGGEPVTIWVDLRAGGQKRRPGGGAAANGGSVN
jgi:hypothetical protein